MPATPAPFVVREPADGEMPQVRALFEEYAAAIEIDLSFQDFAGELAGLPAPYTRPRGAIWLAEHAGRPVGCVAVRPLEADVCEMKRLYVRPVGRGLGIGRALGTRAVDFGRRAGYRLMRLDTLASMSPARTLYASLGFRDVPPYCYNPIADAVFMELSLRE